MPPKSYGTRITVERGIYRDDRGYEVVARVANRSLSKRYPLDTAIKILRAWRDGRVSDLRDEAAPTVDSSTLTAAIAKYKKNVRHLDAPTLASLNAWDQKYGPLPRRRLTATLCQQALDTWKADGKSPQTLFYRVITLQKVWRHLEGPNVQTPVDGIKIARRKARRPIWVPDETIQKVVESMKAHEQPKSVKGQRSGRGQLADAKTRARFMVLASTGQRPAQMQRATREDVDLDLGVWWVRSAKGGDPIPVYLTDDMKAAWQLFIEADAWGEYDTRSFARTVKRNGWPKDVRPYNLRHATALTLSEAGVDLRDISSHLGHRDLKTTTIYAPQLHSRLKRMATTLEGRFNWTKPKP